MSQAVQRHFIRVRELWDKFAQNKQARILCWTVEDDGFDLLRVFHEYEGSEEKELPHLFLPFPDILNTPKAPETQLNEELNLLLKDLAEDEESEEEIPLMDPKEPYIKNLSALAELNQEILELVCSNLFGEQFTVQPDVSKWLTQLLETPEWDPRVRIALVERAEEPIYAKLAERFPEQFIRTTISLNTANLAEEIAQENNAEGPGPDFQKAFAGLNQAVGNGNPKKAEKKASEANEIAEKQNWPTMQVAVAFQLGSSATGEKDSDKALTHYEDAERYAEKAKEIEEPGAEKLVYQSIIAQASVEFPRDHLTKSSALYVRAAELAIEEEDHFSAMDSWRMASFCHESLLSKSDKDPIENYKDFENLGFAWKYGQNGAKMAMALDEELRYNSTVSYLADSLLRLRDRHGYDTRDLNLEKQCEDLLGKDWEERVKEVRS